MTTIVNLVPEPPVFDTGNKTLSAHWVDWYVGAHKCSSEEAIKQANLKLRGVLSALPSTYTNLAPDSAASLQLRDLELDITQYFNAFDYFEKLHAQSFYAMLKGDDPSLFSANLADKLPLQQWLIAKANELNISAQSLRSLATFMVMAAKAVKVDEIDLMVEPEVVSSIKGVPSMKWVLWTRFKVDSNLNDSHVMGVMKMNGDGRPTLFKA